MIYHLEVQAHSRLYGELIESDNYYTEVYSKKELAIEEGKYWLERKIKKLYESSFYCTNGTDTLTIKDMFEDDSLFYQFKIIEVDPEYADNFKMPKHEYECKNLKPTHIINYYDLEGKLLYKDLEYRSPDKGFSYVIERYPEDDESKPNKFNIGDIVTVIDEYAKEDELFVIYGVPKRNDPTRYFENKYYLSTISDGCKFEFCHEYNESKLKKYEGKLEKDSPLILLQRYYRDEINISKETLEKIENNEIILNTKPTYKDVVELKEK